MAHSSSVQVSVTLSEDNWRAILEILRIACQLKGGDWIEWQQSISWTVQSAIRKAKSSSQQAPALSKRRQQTKYDEYHNEMGESEELGALLWAIEENEYLYDENGNAYPAVDLW